MATMSTDTPAARMRLAFDLYEVGVAMQHTRLRREHPDLSDAQIDDLVRAWLADRPGAEFGDVSGRVRVRAWAPP